MVRASIRGRTVSNRWCGGAEPAWAVQSARRVSYQGMDAMLTTFTLINHLKLLERRLELVSLRCARHLRPCASRRKFPLKCMPAQGKYIMQFGITIAPHIDRWDLIQYAEGLGYDRAWVPD